LLSTFAEKQLYTTDFITPEVIHTPEMLNDFSGEK
jgi:hypothetical protein